ncbi:hypothetical protein [Haloimpatiens massiliensis]|uniref:hypothetical protein n=1 Tax=Haloimpatiens massiliensis TaxID=1658110 RepID=UPI0011AEEBF4|nr:hypothetical protein [Haloimpatiens massiliensis]
MEDNKEKKDKTTNTEEETKEETKETQENKEETKKDEKTEIKKEETKIEDKKEEVKDETKEEEKTELNEFEELKRRLEALEKDNKRKEQELKEQTIKNTIMEKIDNKDLQKAVLETGLVKDVEDIEKVVQIVELSKTLNKGKFIDGYKPSDEAKADAYEQAEKKGDIFSMIKQKMNRQ